MVLSLHIWGPAFGLPSIDPACVAAVAYLVEAVPAGEWQLVAAPDAGVSPNGDLPALEHNGVWVGGFNAIVRYLREISSGQWDLDRHLSPSQRADCIAYSALLTSTGRQLLDLSLYVSWRNYTLKTRSAYTSIEPWPIQYFTPSAHRTRARLRTEHLGLSGLDVDLQDDQPTVKMKESMLPATRESLTAQLKRTEHPTRMKLDALVRSLLDPLKELASAQKRKFIFSDDDSSSLDCLILGYLGLALYPKLPQSFLADTIQLPEYAPLVKLVTSMRELCFGSRDILPEEAFASSAPASATTAGRAQGTASGLPWQHTHLSASEIFSLVLQSNMPQHLAPASVSSKKAADPPAAIPDDPARGTRLLQLGTLAAGGLLAVGAYAYTAFRSSGTGEGGLPRGVDVEVDNVELGSQSEEWERSKAEFGNESAQDILKAGFAGL